MDVFSPVPLNKRELVSPGDIFTPTPRNREELEHPVDVFSPALEIRNAGSPVDVLPHIKIYSG